MIDISIIVPVYNVENYLEECIKSIINQTFKNFELILVNDGSTDKSGDICDEFCLLDNRIKVIHKKNEGISDTRNKGIKNARGRYILFVDSDDYIHPQTCDILYKNIEQYKADLAVFNFTRTKKSYYYKNINNKLTDYKIDEIDKFKALEELYGKRRSEFVFSWTKLYRKELFDNIEFEYGRIYEDQLISKNILHNSDKIIYLNVPLYFYRYRSDSYVNSSFNKANLDIIYAYKEDLIFFNKLNYKLKDKVEQNYIFFLFKYYFLAKSELNDCSKELKKIRIDFSKTLYILLRSSNFKFKEKLCWIIFLISPNLYSRISK